MDAIPSEPPGSYREQPTTTVPAARLAFLANALKWGRQTGIGVADESLAPIQACYFPTADQSARRLLSARELAHQQVLQQLVTLIEVPALICKGEALARSLYPMRAQRWRTDIDLWVQAQDRANVERILLAAGATTMPSASGRWIIPERVFQLPAGRMRVNVDVHWQLLSRPALLPAFPFQPIYERASAIPGMGSGSLRQPELGDLLLHACAHRRAHHRKDGDRAIWLLDIDLLWHALSREQRAEVIGRAREGRILGLLRAGLQTCARFSGLILSDDERAELARTLGPEPGASLEDGAPAISDLRFDLTSTRGKQRLEVLRDYALPPWSYMRERFPDVSSAGLAWRYLRRMLTAGRRSQT